MADNNRPWLITPAYFLKEGLKLCNVYEERQDRRCTERNVRAFKAHYGKHPLHLARVWRDMQLIGAMTREEAMSRRSLVAFLVANNFLRCYEVGDIRDARFDIGLDDLQEMTWSFIEKIVLLKDLKIKLQFNTKLGASVDGTHFATNEPRDPDVRRNPKNYSFKDNMSGLNYQIVLNLWRNQAMCIDSGNPASTHDMTAMRQEFIGLVPDGCRVIADLAFTGKTEGEKRIFSVKNNLDDEEEREIKERAKARQEQFNSRLKHYACLSMKFCHGVHRHSLRFQAVVILCQCAIEDTSEHGEPLDTL